MKKLLNLMMLILVVSMLVPHVAFAQEADAGVAPAIVTPVVLPDGGIGLPPEFAAIDPSQNPFGFVTMLVSLIQAGRYGLFAAIAIFGLMALLRRFGKMIPENTVVGKFLSSRWGGWTLNLLLAGSLGFAGTLFAGVHLSLGVVLSILFGAVTFAFTAAGMHEGAKDLFGMFKKEPAPAKDEEKKDPPVP